MTGSIDLDGLDRFLRSDRVPEDSMEVSDLDGFLTGVLAGPELILPSEWLPIIWGDGDPEFESAEEAQTILAAIMGRYNEIAVALDGGPGEVVPIYWEMPEDGVVIADD